MACIRHFLRRQVVKFSLNQEIFLYLTNGQKYSVVRADVREVAPKNRSARERSPLQGEILIYAAGDVNSEHASRIRVSDWAAEVCLGIPPLQGEHGAPRHRPTCLLGDRGYDAAATRLALRFRHIVPLIAKRNTGHGSGLGRWRWVVERTFGWLNQFRRLRVRYEKRADIHEAFLSLGCALICWRALRHADRLS